jgi:LacI family transcriptional regulator
MRTTIKDVARRARVSTATVSLVINNHRRISEDTKKRVLKVIEEMDYHPSQAARGLVSQNTGNIGFILTEDHFLRTEPFYTHIFLGAEFEARKSPYFILLTTIPTGFSDQSPLPRFVLQKSVDAIIIAGKVPDILINRLNYHRIPLVFIDYFPGNGEYPCILTDNLQGGLLATEHLISCGHKHIAFVGGDIKHPSIRDRLLGYKMALEKHNLPIVNDHIFFKEMPTSKEGGYQATASLLQKSKQITALFACNDAMAIGAMQYLKENNLRVPKDISVIGFDDIESDLFQDPPLSSISVSKIDMGSEAFRMVTELIQKKSRGPRKVIIPVELVARQSTCQLNTG